MNSSTPDVAVSGRIGSLQGSVTQLGDWLTVERMVYACLTVVALALRLIGLGWSPLGPDEAQQALRALDAARVLPFDMAGVDPALYSLQRLLFSLFGATEFAARLWPALIGGLSVLCFYAFRSRLGRTGALMAAALWAISPVAVFTSRLGYGDALVPALALTAAAALELAWQRSHSTRPGDDGSPDSHSDARRYTILAGVTVGLMLASGGNAYTVMAMGLAPALIWRDAAHRLWRAVAPSWKAAVLALGVTYALSATFVFMSPDGFAAAAALPGEWARDLVPWFGGYAAFELVGRFVMTEIVVIVP